MTPCGAEVSVNPGHLKPGCIEEKSNMKKRKIFCENLFTNAV